MPRLTPPQFQQVQEFADTTYSASLNLMAALERVLDTLTPGSELGTETAALLEQAQQVNRALATLSRDLARLHDQLATP